MKVIIAVILSCIVVASSLAPPYRQLVFEPLVQPVVQPKISDASKDATILRYDSENNPGNLGYNYAVETSDGQQKEEHAVFENAGTKDESISVVGRYLYPGLTGELYEVKYIADKDGFRAEGAHLPQPVQPIH